MTVINRTQCSACQTVFRISSEQLNMATGQVRCGACLHIFDAAVQGWSTEAVMRATEQAQLDAVAPFSAAITAQVSSPDEQAAQALTQDTPLHSLSVFKMYGRWWLLGAFLGTAVLIIWSWLSA